MRNDDTIMQHIKIRLRHDKGILSHIIIYDLDNTEWISVNR